MKWLQKLWRRFWGPATEEYYKEGWAFAAQALNEGPVSVERLEHQLDAANLFGTSNAFDRGARAALRGEPLP